MAKEDKHTNLIRGRAIKAKTLDQTFSVAQTSTRVGFCAILFGLTDSGAKEEPSLEKTFSLVTPKSTDEAVVLGRTARQTNKIRERKPGVVRRSVKPVKKTLGPVLSMPDSLSGVLSNSGGDHSISGTDTDWDSTSISPQFSLACDSSDESIVASASSNFLPSPNDFLTGFFGTPDHLPHIFLGIEGSSVDEKLDSFISVDQEHLLTQGERSELYDLISGSISSSVSIDDGQPSDTLLSVDNSNNRGGRLYHQASAGNTYPACNTCPTAFETAHSDSHDLKTWLSDDLDLQQSVMDTNFFSSLRDSLDGYAGFYDASLVPIVGSCFGMTGDYHQAAALSPQNRLPSSKVPISIPCVKQVRHLTLFFPEPMRFDISCTAHRGPCQKRR